MSTGTKVRIADDASLVLPGGKALGHRDLKRYYDQNLRPENGQLVQSKVCVCVCLACFGCDESCYCSMRAAQESHARVRSRLCV